MKIICTSALLLLLGCAFRLMSWCSSLVQLLLPAAQFTKNLLSPLSSMLIDDVTQQRHSDKKSEHRICTPVQALQYSVYS